MSKHKTTHRRKAAAVGLALVGVAGLSLASAATLGLDTSSSDHLVQAGREDLTASSCQVGNIVVDFTLAGNDPGQLVTGGPFGYPSTADAVRLTGIHADCIGSGKTLKVALGDDADLSLGEYVGVPAAEVVISLANGFDAGAVNAADIDQISVTIYD